MALRLMLMAPGEGITTGAVTAEHELFSRLLLWTDENHDGISQPVEIRPVADVLSAIRLACEPSRHEDQFGNRFRFRGWAHVRTGPGLNRPKSAAEDAERTIHIWEVAFATGQQPAARPWASRRPASSPAHWSGSRATPCSLGGAGPVEVSADLVDELAGPGDQRVDFGTREGLFGAIVGRLPVQERPVQPA